MRQLREITFDANGRYPDLVGRAALRSDAPRSARRVTIEIGTLPTNDTNFFERNRLPIPGEFYGKHSDGSRCGRTPPLLSFGKYDLHGHLLFYACHCVTGREVLLVRLKTASKPKAQPRPASPGTESGTEGICATVPFKLTLSKRQVPCELDAPYPKIFTSAEDMPWNAAAVKGTVSLASVLEVDWPERIVVPLTDTVQSG